jgi:AcrR family transcriptional regulator
MRNDHEPTTQQNGAAGPGRQIRQKRGRKTYDALIATGFKLLENREFESITVAELAQAAGYSVGAFYARFHSKDEFLEAMVAHHLRARSESREQILATVPRGALVHALIDDLAKYYWQRRGFWRAALMRSTGDPEFWEPIQHHAREFFAAVLARIQSDAGRRLTKTERRHVRFALQLVLATINNAIVNRPNPNVTGQAAFVKDLERAFRRVSDYDRLIGNDTR